MNRPLKVVIPATFQILDVQAALAPHVPVVRIVRNEPGVNYQAVLSEYWAEGESFINVEHDILCHPGALDELADCPEILCGYGHGDEMYGPDHGPKLGCIKFEAEFIAKFPDVWSETLPTNAWSVTDTVLARAVQAAGFPVHQHFPGVVNLRDSHPGGGAPLATYSHVVRKGEPFWLDEFEAWWS